MTVQHPTVRLGPGQSTTDTVTIRVPKGATKGEHYGVIWTEQAAPATDSHGVAIRVVARVGIRVYLAVGRGGLPPAKFAIMSPAGPWLATVTLQSGLDVATARATVLFAGPRNHVVDQRGDAGRRRRPARPDRHRHDHGRPCPAGPPGVGLTGSAGPAFRSPSG
jgi:hypothetical protein